MFFAKQKVPPTYSLIDTPKKVAWLSSQLCQAAEFSFDIETTHPTIENKDKKLFYRKNYPIYVAGVAFAWGRQEAVNPWRPGLAAYLPLVNSDETPFWGSRQTEVLSVLKEIIESEIPKVTHNGKFDAGELAKRMGIRTRNIVHDTMLAHALIDEDKRKSSHALKSDYAKDGTEKKVGCADAYLNIEGGLFKEGLASALDYYDPDWRRYSRVPLDIVYPYACADADMTLSLKYVFEPIMEREGTLECFQHITMKLQHAIMLLELHGVPLNIDKALAIEKEQLFIMSEQEPVIHKLAGGPFLVSSTEQLGRVLFENLHLPGGERNKKGWIVDAETLRSIDHPIVEPVLKYRRAQKIQSTYVRAALDLVEEVDGCLGWVHPTYWLDTVTGRLRCNDPNLTNLPRKDNGGDIVKSLWECGEDYRFIFSDFSQIELCVIAHVSEEPTWIEGFNAGYDMHAAMAKSVFGLSCSVPEVKDLYPELRTQAKAINFGIAYGESEYSLSQKLGITYEAADDLVNNKYFGSAPVLKAWIDGVHETAYSEGVVRNMFGRVRHLPDAQITIPLEMNWPSKDDRLECYRRCILPRDIGVVDNDVHAIAEATLKQLIRVNKKTRFFRCCDCKHLKSCFVNGWVKYLSGVKGRAMRQAVNTIIQGSAADMSSLSLVWMTDELRQRGLRACPVLYIHDEIGCYSHVEDVEAVKAVMQDCMVRRLKEVTHFRVPLKTDTQVVQCWGDKK